MIQRHMIPHLQRLASEYGVVSLTGPRQSGKTTLVRSVFPDHQYVNFENYLLLDDIKQDPIGFLKSIDRGVILDEVQKFPEILSLIQLEVDEHFQPGKFILTGSQNLLLLDSVTQTLAGRVGILKLLPLSVGELRGADLLPANYREIILKGFYPSIYDKSLTSQDFYNGYLNTYVERDVRSIQNIGNLTNFTRFIRLLATRVGQQLHLNEIGTQVGVSQKTIQQWFSILETSYIVFRLQPYFRNYGKRISKSPKFYFTDTGFAARLLGLDSEEEVGNYYNLGALFENLVVADVYKHKLNHLSSTELYYWRDKQGHEVDLLLDHGNSVTPIEIKASASFHPDYTKGLKFFSNLESSEKQLLNKSWVVYNGTTQKMPSGQQVLHFSELEKINI